MCAGDALYTLMCFLWLSITSMSPHSAINFKARRRFRDTKVNDTGSFSALQQNLVFRVMFFVFGALPQLPGGLFFGSFMVLGLIVLLSSEEDLHHSNTLRSQSEENLDRYIGDGVLAVSLWFDYYLLATAAHAVVIMNLRRLGPYTMGLVITGFTTIVKMWMPE